MSLEPGPGPDERVNSSTIHMSPEQVSEAYSGAPPDLQEQMSNMMRERAMQMLGEALKAKYVNIPREQEPAVVAKAVLKESLTRGKRMISGVVPDLDPFVINTLGLNQEVEIAENLADTEYTAAPEVQPELDRPPAENPEPAHAVHPDDEAQQKEQQAMQSIVTTLREMSQMDEQRAREMIRQIVPENADMAENIGQLRALFTHGNRQAVDGAMVNVALGQMQVRDITMSAVELLRRINAALAALDEAAAEPEAAPELDPDEAAAVEEMVTMLQDSREEREANGGRINEEILTQLGNNINGLLNTNIARPLLVINRVATFNTEGVRSALDGIQEDVPGMTAQTLLRHLRQAFQAVNLSENVEGAEAEPEQFETILGVQVSRADLTQVCEMLDTPYNSDYFATPADFAHRILVPYIYGQLDGNGPAVSAAFRVFEQEFDSLPASVQEVLRQNGQTGVRGLIDYFEQTAFSPTRVRGLVEAIGGTYQSSGELELALQRLLQVRRGGLTTGEIQSLLTHLEERGLSFTPAALLDRLRQSNPENTVTPINRLRRVCREVFPQPLTMTDARVIAELVLPGTGNLDSIIRFLRELPSDYPTELDCNFIAAQMGILDADQAINPNAEVDYDRVVVELRRRLIHARTELERHSG